MIRCYNNSLKFEMIRITPGFPWCFAATPILSTTMMLLQPALYASRIPLSESSKIKHSEIGTPIISAADKNICTLFSKRPSSYTIFSVENHWDKSKDSIKKSILSLIDALAMVKEICCCFSFSKNPHAPLYIEILCILFLQEGLEFF